MSGRAFRDFLAPAPLLAVAVMAINDFWLKPRFGNALTGKLSDLAICFFLPSYLAALAEPLAPLRRGARLLTGALLTVAVFCAIKLSQELADGFVALLSVPGRALGLSGFRAIADPGDLVALLLVPLAIWHAHRRLPLWAEAGPPTLKEGTVP